MFAVERRGLVQGEPAGRSILRIVKPESHMEGIGRRQTCGRIETEDLIDQDGLDRNLCVAIAVCLNVGLVPREAKVREGRIGLTVASRLVFCVVNRSKARFGFRWCAVKIKTSLRLPLCNVIVAVGWDPKGTPRQSTNFGLTARSKVFSESCAQVGKRAGKQGQDCNCKQRQTFHF